MFVPDLACPVCGGQADPPFLRRDGVPFGQNFVMPDAPAARGIARGRLHLAACNACGFVWNVAFDPALMAYDAHYDNTQSSSPAFEAHMDERVRHMTGVRGERGRSIVEVGCGKGHFLRKLVEAGNTGVGFDTSYVGPASELDGRLRFETRYYGPDAADVAAEVVVCRHVIEHVPEPMQLLGDVRQALRPGTRLYFETPCVDWILRHRVMWDFFHEHCSLFTVRSLTTAFERAGFTVTGIGHVFGGQYLWAEAVLGADAPPVTRDAGETPALARAYGDAERTTLAGLRAQLVGLAARGGVALWGAGAKGATLANLVDPGGELLRAVADLNPNKQGRFVPGTGHPIVAPAALPGLGVKTAVLMNPNYRAENEALIRAQGLDIALVEVGA